jgi:hypothetical protein
LRLLRHAACWPASHVLLLLLLLLHVLLLLLLHRGWHRLRLLHLCRLWRRRLRTHVLLHVLLLMLLWGWRRHLLVPFQMTLLLLLLLLILTLRVI